jgi:hypothetical protein
LIIVKQYSLEESEEGYYVRTCEIHVCPICGHVLYVIGTRKRKLIKEDGEIQVLIIRRLRCKDCRAIHHELPDIVIPYKRHCANTVERIINGDDSEACCEGRTIDRIKKWWSVYRPYFESVLASLREEYGDVFSQHPAPKEMIRAVANANLWVHTRSVFLSG